MHLAFREKYMFNKVHIKKFDWYLLGILVVGGLVRYWGINFGLPHTECRPDETIQVSQALGFFSGDFNPHYFAYPTFYRYVLFGAYLLYFLIGKTLGRYSAISDMMDEFVVNPTNFYLIDRFISAFMGTATIFIVYKIAENLFDRKTALVSSLFLSLAYLHIRDSHFGVTDASMTFLIMLSILLIIRSYRNKTVNSYVISGITTGLATSTKYNAILLIIPMSIVHFLNVIEQRNKINKSSEVDTSFQLPFQLVRVIYYGLAAVGVIIIIIGIIFTPDFIFSNLFTFSSRFIDEIQLGRFLAIFIGSSMVLTAILFANVKLLSGFLDKRILLYFGILIFAFLLGTPFFILDFKGFMAGFLWILGHLNSGHGVNLGRGWWYHSRFTLPLGLGWSMFWASLAGSLILVRSDMRKAIIFLSFPLSYYLVIGKGYTVPLRYMMPMIPFACIAAAIFVIFISNRIVNNLEITFLEKPIILFLATLIIFQSAYRMTQFNGLLAKRDNRLIVAEWVNENIPENSSIYQAGSVYGNLQYQPTYLDGNLIFHQSSESLKSLEENQLKFLAEGQNGIAKLLQYRINYLRNNNIKRKYEEWEYNEEVRQFIFDNQEQEKLPDYIVKNDYLFINKNHLISENMENIIGNNYNKIQSFKSISIDNKKNWFDQIDAFYLPFSGFKEIQRSGPNIYIYKKIN